MYHPEKLGKASAYIRNIGGFLHVRDTHLLPMAALCIILLYHKHERCTTIYQSLTIFLMFVADMDMKSPRDHTFDAVRNEYESDLRRSWELGRDTEPFSRIVCSYLASR